MSTQADSYRDGIQDRARKAERASIIAYILSHLHQGILPTVDAIRRGDHQ